MFLARSCRGLFNYCNHLPLESFSPTLPRSLLTSSILIIPIITCLLSIANTTYLIFINNTYLTSWENSSICWLNFYFAVSESWLIFINFTFFMFVINHPSPPWGCCQNNFQHLWSCPFDNFWSPIQGWNHW